MHAIVISDIHGIKTNLPKIRNRYHELKCQKLIVLGDLYWGDYEEEYDQEYVRGFLESFKNNLMCLKGNCDFLVNISKEPFAIEDDQVVNIEDNIFITHGHTYNDKNWLLKESILIFGHYHVPFIKRIESNLFINPGSISKPRSNTLPSYLFINNNEFTIFDINDKIIFNVKYEA